MHLELKNIRAENFVKAEENLELIEALLAYEGAGEAFVGAKDFYHSKLDGIRIQKHTYLGRYLSFTPLMTETLTWKD